MTEALLLVTTGSLLAVSVATLVIATLTLRDARRSVDLAKGCMEHLREERARLLEISKEEPEQARPRVGPLSLELEQEREGRARERRDAERRIARLEREIQDLRGTRRESPLPVGVGSSEAQRETREPLGDESLPPRRTQETGRTPQTASFPETMGWEPAEGPPKNKKSRRRGVWHPHPDDGADRGKAPTRQEERVESDAPIKMFRKHYDKYLENYQGYVKLAEKLNQTRDNGEVPPGSPREHEWEKRLRRVNHGMERTTARLDILEEHNPELATDDRISRRASLARRRAELERSQQGRS